ncbi:MAG: N-6 DNA methylase [Treponema sp.]|jgi:type I restriction-modification system DNA methylase subunit|nr:N-6 DNA methylase [Treponema sp.]
MIISTISHNHPIINNYPAFVALDGFFEQLKSLVSLFSTNITQYKSGHYDEANTRTDFIDKFFFMLDWDIANSQGYSESYREVVREDKVKIDGSKKAPDYSFRIGGVRKFFVEAKKPSVNIKDATEPAYQVRRYAYTAKLPLSILTNFAEFAVYDTRIKPNKDDKSGTARIFYCTFDQYEQNFDFIISTFSKNAILKGSFDKYIEENKNKKGTSEVDAEILALVEEWRVELAKNIAKNNPDLSIYDLNTVVQKIIDRIIFLRIAEDKGIEDENLLLSVAKGYGVYEKLIHIFIKANAKYNSGLFSDIDWIDRVNIDDKVLSHIIVNLYYPECPYEFSILPVEILGSIYERFLGKTIHFRAIKGDAHTAIIEEKPEIKKAGGVYYTPQYIVDYIVQNTVGEKIKNKTPQEISGVKICDPACGSGSFLVGAYQYLLNYHLDYYTQAKNIKTALKSERVFQTAFHSYKLTIEEKQRILTNSIYGVDIDNQAVEVTKLSLYLKLLENEGKEAEGWLFRYSDKTLLPSLENNIKCGNSLIGTEFYAQHGLEFTGDDRVKVNCFDWNGKGGFEEIFKNGGFDAVIGNPPWGADIDKYTQYYEKHYPNSTKSYKDSFKLFIEKGFLLLKTDGYFGFIVPSVFMFQPRYIDIRRFIRNNTTIHKLWNIGDGVFGTHVNAPCGIFAVEKRKPHKEHKVLFLDTTAIKNNEQRKDAVANPEYRKIKQESYNKTVEETFVSFFRDLKENEVVLEDILTFKDAGINYQRINVGLTDKGNSDLSDRLLYEGEKENEDDIEYWKGADINGYFITPSTNRFVRINTTKSLRKNERVILNADYFAITPKIIWRQTAPFPIAALDIKGIWFGRSIQAGIVKPEIKLDIRYILSIMNSKYFRWLYEQNVREEGRVFPQIKLAKLVKLPIPMLDFSVKADKVKHDNLVSLANKILELKQKEASEKNQQLKTMITRQIEGLSRTIDSAVYELYGLTEDDFKAGEGKIPVSR